MPTDNWRRTSGLLPLRALPILGAAYPTPNLHIIASWSAPCVGAYAFNAFTSGSIGTANRAFVVPFVIAHPFLVRKVFWMNGTTATTNSADVAVYDDAFNRLVSGGGTAISGANSTQEVDVTDTLLKPGRYYMGYAQNGTTATPLISDSSASFWRIAGGVQQDTAYPLPNPLTPAAWASTMMPLFGIASRTLAS